MTMRRLAAPAPLRRAQSGVVLFIALIVMVALSIAGIALVRSVDTGMSVAANLGFRQASISPTTWAVEKAIAAMFEAKTIPLDAPDLDENYYPYRYEVKTPAKPEGGQVRKEFPIHWSNVSPAVTVDGKVVPTRVRFETKADGSKVRVAVKTGQPIGAPIKAAAKKAK